MVAFFRKHKTLFITLVVFILLFLGGLRVSLLGSFLVAVIDTFWLLLFVWAFDAYLRSSFRNRIPRIVSAILTVPTLGAIVGGMLATENVTLNLLLDSRDEVPFVYPLFRASLLTMGSMIGVYAKRARVSEAQAEQMCQEKQEMELQLLRNQMNPHFTFNALNTVYTLAYMKDPRAPEMILKLAEMQRYMTDECQADKVPLEKEVKYIENFIAFQEMRYGTRPNLTFTYGIDAPKKEVPPMILQPFVENCFKHGDITMRPEGVVDVSLTLKGKTLRLVARNTKGATGTPAEEAERVGVGNTNVERRLALYFPHAYTLDVAEDDVMYTIDLTITLS